MSRLAQCLTLLALTALAASGCSTEDDPFVDGDIAAGPDTWQMPADTNVPPADTTQSPADTSVPPADTTVPPADTSVPPADTSVPPADTSVPPADTNVPPADTTEPPADTTEPPADASTGLGGAETTAQITAARAAEDGVTDLPITGAMVTQIKPLLGEDPAGFFVQAENAGAALFIISEEAVAAGDAVSFVITEMGSDDGLRQATLISDLTILSSGNDPSGLVQDVSASADLITAIEDYESELVTLSATTSGDYTFAGPAYRSIAIATDGLQSDEGLLRLRIPLGLADEVGLVSGCHFTLTMGPLWRHTNNQDETTVQPSAWTVDALSLNSCPAPIVLSAVATSATTVSIHFDRQIEPSSVAADGSQFIFDGDVTASAAAADGKTVLVTTSEQTPGASVLVTVTNTVTDTLGAALSDEASSATFVGYQVPAVLQFTEINANIKSGCDLIEFHAVEGGALAGLTIYERSNYVMAFDGGNVAAGDVIVVHFNNGSDTCNPMDAVSEMTDKAEYPNATYASHYDNAYDWWTSDKGLTATTNVLTLTDAFGAIQDAVLLTDDATTDAAKSNSEQAALVADAGEWTTLDGTVPAEGFAGVTFSAHAVVGLKSTGTDALGMTLQRIDDTDDNNASDWGLSESTYGAANGD